jgi:hypothetical protein
MNITNHNSQHHAHVRRPTTGHFFLVISHTRVVEYSHTVISQLSILVSCFSSLSSVNLTAWNQVAVVFYSMTARSSDTMSPTSVPATADNVVGDDATREAATMASDAAMLCPELPLVPTLHPNHEILICSCG